MSAMSRHRWATACGFLAAVAFGGCKPDAAPVEAPPPPPPAVVAPVVVDAGPPEVDAGPPDAGPEDAGPVDAGPVDAGAPVRDAGGPVQAIVAPTEVLPATAEAALQKPMRACFRQAEKIHWGPQVVVLKATVAAKDGVGVLTDGKVIEESLHDAQSHGCFLAGLAAVRFRASAADVGQEKTFRFQHVPQAQ
jgi:hypothetical protein